MLAKVDVENPQALRLRALEESPDRAPGRLAPLAERPEADRIGPGGQRPEVVRPGDVVPRDALGDLEPRLARRVELDLHEAGRMVRINCDVIRVHAVSAK